MKALMQKTLLGTASLAVTLSLLAAPLTTAFAATPPWDVTGTYVATFVLSGDYAHDMSLTQDAEGNVTGLGGYPAGGAYTYSWHVTSGTVAGDQLNLTAVYDLGAPGTIMHMQGTIAADGTISGVWDDDLSGGRNGTWSTTAGAATAVADLAAEDFGVVDYDTGPLGQLAGYTAGFGLTNATLADIQSVTVQLYSGSTLLQTNTGSSTLIAALPGAQFSSPFDVSGDFDYATDGYWMNDRETEYGQSVPATRVVATVTLDDGTVLTAENTNLTGDPSTIYPDTPPAPVLTDKDQCKKGGWEDFGFKNQGQCIRYVNTGQDSR